MAEETAVLEVEDFRESNQKCFGPKRNGNAEQ